DLLRVQPPAQPRAGCAEILIGTHVRMPVRILDGSGIAAAIRASVAPRVAAFTDRAGRQPCLGIVLVGNDPASEIYVRNKVKAGTDSGLRVDLQRLPATASLDELLALVDR